MQPSDYHQPDATQDPHAPDFHSSPAHHHSLGVNPPAPAPPLVAPGPDQPVAVIKVLSVRGVEYAMMTIALWVVASTLAWIVLNMLNGSSGYDSLVVPISALIVCAPIFGLLFIRLKRGELANPSLRWDASKRRWSQTTQLFSYIACLINLIYFVYVILQHTAGKGGTSVGKAAVNLVVILAIAGGILAYYWFDEHRARRA